MSDQRLNKLAKLLVNYSAGVKPGDFVFVSCEDAAAPWAAEVVKEAVLAGGHVEYILSNSEANHAKLQYSSEKQLKEENFIMRNVLEKADVWLSAWGTANTRSNSGIDPEKIRLSSVGATSWRKLL